MYRLSGAQLQKVQAARNKGVQLPPVRSYEFHRVNRADGSIRLCGVSRDSALKQRNRNVSAEPRNTIKSSRNDATPSVKPRGRGGGTFKASGRPKRNDTGDSKREAEDIRPSGRTADLSRLYRSSATQIPLCPKCATPLSKPNPDSHIMCRMFRAHFCYLCGSSMDAKSVQTFLCSRNALLQEHRGALERWLWEAGEILRY